MDIAEKFILLIVVLQFVWNILEKVRGPQADAPTEDFDPADNEQALTTWAENAVEQVERAAQRAAVLIEGAQGLHRRLNHAGGALGRVAEALAESQAELDRVSEELTQVQAALAGATPEQVLAVSNNSDHFQRIFARLHHLDRQLGTLRDLATTREDGDVGPVMADADTLADSLLRQMRAFADAHGIAMPDEHPITVPAEQGEERVLLDLFPRHPIVVVPPDFRGDVMRWVVLAHEMGHVLARYVPGFERELQSIIGPTDEPLLPHQAGKRVLYDLNATFARWLPEIAADVLSTMMLGPAALRGVVNSFAEPDLPEAVVTVEGDADGRTVSRHPPRHLRVVWMAALLHRMGFDVEAKGLRRRWDRLHGAPTEIIVPSLFGASVRVAQLRFNQVGEGLVEEIYTRTWRSLRGYTLAAVAGLEMSPGVWARVQKRTLALIEDAPFNDDPIVVIAAAIEAAGRAPAAQARIARGVQRAIVSEGERRVADPNYAQRGARDDWAIDMRDVIDAVVLREAWFRRSRG